MRWLLVFLLASVLFNVLHDWLRKIGLAKGVRLDPIGFARGDRSHTL